jgi:hypothetical protein
VESHGANGFEKVMKKFFLVSELSATITLLWFVEYQREARKKNVGIRKKYVTDSRKWSVLWHR